MTKAIRPRRTSTTDSHVSRKRSLLVETLEQRHLLAGDFLQNSANPNDVNDDERVSVLDALIVVNSLTKSANAGATASAEQVTRDSSKYYLDVTGDGNVSAGDALQIINKLGEGEESVGAVGLSVDEDDSLTISVADLLSNSPGGTITAVQGFSTDSSSFQSQRGGGLAITIDPVTGNFVYTPPSNYSGPDSLTYTITTAATAEEFTIPITVNPVNDAPAIGVPGGFSTDEDISIDLPGITVSDIDGDDLAIDLSVSSGVLSVGGKIGGTISVDGSSISGLSYVPNLNFNGTDTLTISASDGDDDTTDSVNITVNPVNDGPLLVVPGKQSFFTDFDNRLSVVPSVTDVDGEAVVELNLSLSSGTIAPAQVLGQVVVDVLGQDSIVYSGFSADVFDAIGNTTFSFAEPGNQSLTLTVNDANEANPLNDTGVIDLSVINSNFLQKPNGLTIGVNNSVQVRDVAVKPIPGITDSDFRLAISAFNPGLQTFFGTTTLSSTDGLRFINGDGTNDQNMFFEGTLEAINNALNGLTISVGNQTVNGQDITQLNNNTLQLVISNPDGSFVRSGAILINAVNTNVFLAGNDDFATTDEDTNVFVDVLVNDFKRVPSIATMVTAINEQPITFAQTITLDSGGQVRTDGTGIDYTPAPNFSGDETFTYTISDGNVEPLSDDATLTIRVNDVNDAPNAMDDEDVVVGEGSTFGDNPINVLLNDASGPLREVEASQTVTITDVSDPTNGQTRINHQGTGDPSDDVIEYQPDPGFVDGFDTFTYTITDDGGLTDTATVTIELAPVFQGARNDSFAVLEGTTSSSIDVLANDDFEQQVRISEINGGSIFQGQSVSTNFGIVSLDINESLVYSPSDVNFFGTDTFTYTLTDSGGVQVPSATGTVTIDVVPVNDLPVATSDSVTTTSNTQLTFSIDDLLADDDAGPNESDQSLTITSISGGQGALRNNDDGTITYTPPSNFGGEDVFTYTITDNGLTGGEPDPQPASATLTIEVTDAQTGPLIDIIPGVFDDRVIPPFTSDVLVFGSETVTRSDGGSFLEDGFMPGTTVMVIESGDFFDVFEPELQTEIPTHVFNNNGLFTVGTVTANTLTINGNFNVDDPTTTQTENSYEDANAKILRQVNNVTAGTDFLLGIFSEDNRNIPDTEKGPFAVYTDVLFDSNILSPGSSILPANGFTENVFGDFSSDGLIDGVGGSRPTGSTPLGDGQHLVTTIPFTAGNQGGTVQIDLGFADSLPDRAVQLSGLSQGISEDMIMFQSATIDIVADIVAIDDGPFTFAEDSGPQTIDVLANDSVFTPPNTDPSITDVNGDDSGTTTTSNGGTISFNSGNLTYTPADDFNGSDSFTYTISNGQGATDSASVTIGVTPVNDPPINSVPGEQTIDEDNDLIFSGANGISVDNVDGNITVQTEILRINLGGQLIAPTVPGVTQSNPSDNSLLLEGMINDVNNVLSGIFFRPDPNVNGTGGSLRVTTTDLRITDGSQLSDTDTVNITISPINDGPINTVPGPKTLFNTDTLQFNTGDFQVSDVDTSNLEVTLEVDPEKGGMLRLDPVPRNLDVSGNNSSSLTLNGLISNINSGLGNLVYDPFDEFIGTDVLLINTSDSQASDQDSVSIMVAPPRVPFAADDLFIVTEDSVETTLPVKDNDLVPDSDGDPNRLTITSFNGQGLSGSISVSTDRGGTVRYDASTDSFIYTPAADFSGTDTFTYTVTSSPDPGQGETDPATVDITVQPINDGPIITVPGSQSFLTDFDNTFSDANGNALQVSDVDVNNTDDDVQINLMIGDGALTVSDTSNLSSISGNGTASITIRGSVNNINAALDSGVTFNTSSGGNQTLSATVNDLGNTGEGGSLSDSGSIDIEVLDFVPVDITGRVFIDHPVGIDPGIGGIDVILSGTDFQGNPVDLIDTTESIGSYEFSNVKPNQPGNPYTITAEQPVFIQGVELDSKSVDTQGRTGGIEVLFPVEFSDFKAEFVPTFDLFGSTRNRSGIDIGIFDSKQSFAMFVGDDWDRSQFSNPRFSPSSDGLSGVLTVFDNQAGVDRTANVSTQAGTLTYRGNGMDRVYRIIGGSGVLELDGLQDEIANLQSDGQGALLDFRNLDGIFSAVGSFSSEDTLFSNFVGFYQIEDEDGGIDTDGDGSADLNPGDAGYLQAVVQNRLTDIALTTNPGEANTFKDLQFQGGELYAPFIIVDAGPNTIDFNSIDRDRNRVYTPYITGNADGQDHFRSLGDNAFGMEDLFGLGDADFDDVVIVMNFTSS